MSMYRVRWIAHPGDLYVRVMELIDIANGFFIIEELHITPSEWMLKINCNKSSEHVRAMFTQYLRASFPNINEVVQITKLEDDE